MHTIEETATTYNDAQAIQERFSAIVAQYLKPDPQEKVALRFRAVGRAPILRQQVFRIAAMHRFESATAFLKQQLGLPSTDPIYVYVNMSFIPAPDELLHNLHAVRLICHNVNASC